MKNNFKATITSILIFSLFLLPGCKDCGSPPPTPHKRAMERFEEQNTRIKQIENLTRKIKKKPDKKKTLKVAVPYLPSHLNPYLKISKWGYRISMHNIYESLVDRDAKTGKLVPGLAKSWSMEENGKIYRFWIRDDVRWQDGRPLSTEDIVFTLSLLTIPRIKKGPFMEDINYTLMRVDKIPNNGVRIVLRNPNAYFLEHLVELPVLPSHVFYRGISKRSHGSLNPIGTGPYRMLEWVEDDKIILERNEFYWGQTPQVQRLVFKEIKSPAKALVEIRRKKIDLLPELSPVHYPSQITSNIKKDYKLYKFVPPDFSYLLWNTRNKMISDFRIRRAFSMLINRELIIKKVYRDLAVSCNGPYWRPGGLGDKSIKSWPYDPTKAKKLLDQVGWKDRDGDGIRDKNNKKLKLVILLPLGNPRARQLLKIIKTEYFKAGIEVLIVPTAWKLLSRHLKQRKFAAAFLTWKGRPYEDFTPIFHSTGKNNYGVVYNIFIDRLITRMRQQKSFENLLDYSKKLEKMLHSYLPITFLFRPVEISLVHRRFSNVIPTSFGFKYKEFKTKKIKNK